MAAFNYDGNTYFYTNGRWLDSNSHQVVAELSAALNQSFSMIEVKLKEEEQKAKATKKSYKSTNSSFIGYRQGYTEKSITKKAHRRATQTVHCRTVELTKDQKRALGALESGKNVFLSGEAGTGKSFVLNEYIYRNRNKNVIVCAPTGIAAINLGGSTLHRVFNVPISVTKPGDYDNKPDSAVVKADVIIIDEISMCRFDIFEYVVRTIRKAEELQQNKTNMDAMNNGKMPEVIRDKQIIVVGDFFQLSPVITPTDREIFASYWDIASFGEGFAFHSKLWEELGFKNIVLKEIIRQKGSLDFIENLNKIRIGNTEGIKWFNVNVGKTPISNSIYLCGTNKAADAINLKEAEALEGNPIVYKAQVTGQVLASDKMTYDELSLKVNIQVMILVNDTEEGYQNGSLGKIISLNDNSVDVRLNTGKCVTVKAHDWEILSYEVQKEKLEKIVLGNFKQIPLKIAYAITIHKSQGQTYSSANISPDCFAAGQLYVALSRVQTIEGMSLEHDIKYGALKTSDSVKAFYADLDETVEAYEIEDFPKEEEIAETRFEPEKSFEDIWRKMIENRG